MANNPPSELTTLDTLKFAKAMVANTSKNSLTRRAADDSMFIYPMVMSADVPIDDGIPYAKEVERTLASLLVALISMNSNFCMHKYLTPADYLKTFHSNENANSLLRAMNVVANQALDSYMPLRRCANVKISKATFVPDEIARGINPDFVMEAFFDTGLCFNVKKLNDEYTPHVSTQTAMESLTTELRNVQKPAMEANEPGSVDYMMGRVIQHQNTNPDGGTYLNSNMRAVPYNVPETGAPDKVQKRTVIARTPNGHPMVDRDGKVLRDEVFDVMSRQGAKQGGLVRNDKMTGMEPTLVNIQLTGENGNAVIVHNVMLAVKVDCRICTADCMVDNLSKAVMGSRAIFNFIKWTRGQYGILKDFIFGVSNAKENAIGSRDTRQWITRLKRGKIKAAVSRLTGDNMPPIMTIVATANDVAKVQQATGVDLTNPYSVIKMMNQYYMLGFSIIDTANGKVMTLFDGDTDFSVTTLNALRGRNNAKEADISNYVSILRAMGGFR